MYLFTATPYRSDGRKVALKGMKVLRRSLAQHMDECDVNGITFAPKHLHSQIVPIGVTDDGVEVNRKQFTGNEPPPAAYTDQLMDTIGAQWVTNGKPKTIIRVPGMRRDPDGSGGSGEFVAKLIDCLRSRGARVCDATGVGSEQQVKFIAILKSEQGIKLYNDSEVDVIVGIQRVLEGTNWPICSHVYSIGMPGSLTTVVQFIGRSNRNKYWLPDYPVEFRDNAYVTFFVPCGNGSLNKLSLNHSRHALMTACYLADHEAGAEWVVQNSSRSGIKRGMRRRPAKPARPVGDTPVQPEDPTGEPGQLVDGTPSTSQADSACIPRYLLLPRRLTLECQHRVLTYEMLGVLTTQASPGVSQPHRSTCGILVPKQA